MFLEKVQPSIHQQHDRDDDEIVPLADDCRKQCRQFDHPRNRSPESSENPVPDGFFLFPDFVVAVLFATMQDFVRGKPGAGIHMQRVERV